MASGVPHQVQIAFERADLQEDAPWFDANYDKWHKQMTQHASASFGCFEWAFYRKWLKQNADRPLAAQTAAYFDKAAAAMGMDD